MGAWGPAIFSDDLACDVRGSYVDYIKEGKSSEEATRLVTQAYIGDVTGTEEEPVFWFALALTQWKMGRLQDIVKSKALEFIDSGVDLRRWREPGNDKTYKKRVAALEKLKDTLLLPMPPARKPRPAPKKIPIEKGDVYEITTEKGVAYFQCVREARPPSQADIIRVLPGVYPGGDVNLEALVASPEEFFVQFLLEAAIRKKLVKSVGNFPVPPSGEAPMRYRCKIGKVWSVVQIEPLKYKPIKELRHADKLLSPYGIWNYALLVQCIAEGWRLEDWV